jgi:hypothetical protein
LNFHFIYSVVWTIKDVMHKSLLLFVILIFFFWIIQFLFSTSNDENNKKRKLTMIVNCMIISIVMTNSTHNCILMRHSDTNNVSKFFYIMHKFFVTQQLRILKFNLNMNIKIINFICSINIKYNNSIKWKHFLFNEKIIFFLLRFVTRECIFVISLIISSIDVNI